jgi:hypothetical protein
MVGTTRLNLEHRASRGLVTALVLLLAAPSVGTSRASAGSPVIVIGGRMTTPAGGLFLLSAKQDGYDLRWSWVMPDGYDAIHIRWSGPGRPEVQEEYTNEGWVRGGSHPSYTIHNVHENSFYRFKVQTVKKNHKFLGEDQCSSWADKTYLTGRYRHGPAPFPAPPPSPALTTALHAPKNVLAERRQGTEIHVSWTGDKNADSYLVERRIAAAPLAEGPGSTPWSPASGKLKRGTAQFIA